jgi:hypothetical protein
MSYTTGGFRHSPNDGDRDNFQNVTVIFCINSSDYPRLVLFTAKPVISVLISHIFPQQIQVHYDKYLYSGLLEIHNFSQATV